MKNEYRKDTPVESGSLLPDEAERALYDFRDEENEENFYRMEEGLTPEIVREISRAKHDPDWMLAFRLKSLEIYHKIPVPDWGPPIDGLDMDKISSYVRPKTDMQQSWDDVPAD
ncbi:MAG: hypothetical protein IKZ41_08515, partial [Clostridia bacterium]|nr:hypothetical protein [Clostridia bacterium]